MNFGYCKCSLSAAVSENSPVRSRGAGSEKTSFSLTSSSLISSSSILGAMSSCTSRRTGGRPTLRRSSSFSSA
ncbi:Uncharacterised protein [Mycobacteroides abscessus subsp. abscessus]|nr:Uncharacterised protein [Mycobacteroides abscessus subsp. abscessus]